MGLLANDVRLDRRSGLRALLIVFVVLAVAFAAAWLTLGRKGRFQSLAGAYLSFEAPPSFTQIDEEGAGGSITSLGGSVELERTYASTEPGKRSCPALGKAFEEGPVEVLATAAGNDVACSFRGPIGRFSVEADIRNPKAFIQYVDREGLDVPTLPQGTRSVATISVRD